LPSLYALAAILKSIHCADAAAFPKAGDREIHMVILGDSIMWGQGLEEPDKNHTLVANMLRTCNDSLTVQKASLAHSGAIIGANNNQTGPALPGEVLVSLPSILQQTAQFSNPTEAAEVDVVLLDGGINDVGLTTILDPSVPLATLDSAVRQHCLDDMQVLLDRVTTTFTNAIIVVSGYYQIVSEESNPAAVETLLLLFRIVFQNFDIHARDEIAARCLRFATRSRNHLNTAVDATNQRLSGSPRVFFADPGFGPGHALFASNSRLFGLTLLGGPEDPVADERHSQCLEAGRQGDGLLVCERASIAHTNEAGARAYARAIFDALTTGGKGLVWADFSIACPPSPPCGAGTFESPFGRLLPEAITAVPEGGTIRIKSSSEPGSFTLTKPCVIEACGGRVLIGHE
jgi:lysophospholipase L1-like esterase